MSIHPQNDLEVLGNTARDCKAYARTLYYKEKQYEKVKKQLGEEKLMPFDITGDLINCYTKLGQPEAADGVLENYKKELESKALRMGENPKTLVVWRINEIFCSSNSCRKCHLNT